MDIRLIITRSASYLIIFPLIVISIFLINHFNSNLLVFYSLLLLNVSFWAYFGHKVHLRIQTPLEKKFLKGSYSYRQALLKFTAALHNSTSKDLFLKNINHCFLDDVEVAQVYIFLPEQFETTKEVSKTLSLVHAHNHHLNTTQGDDYTSLVSPEFPVLLTQTLDKETKKQLHPAQAIVGCYRTDNTLMCLIVLGKKLTETAYTQDDIDLLHAVSQQIPPALELIRKARVGAEIDVAHRIQMDSLPKTPHVPGLDLACHMSPSDEVGGDYYDIFTSNHHSWIILGDVAGHGIGSGLVMFMVQSIMTTLLESTPNLTPAELNFMANQVLCKNFERHEESRPMTLATLSTSDGRTFKLSGSHDNLFIYRSRTQTVETVSVDHFPFGIGLTADLDKDLFINDTLILETNDVLLLTTDGITEAFQNGQSDTEQYGENRLKDILQKHGTDDSNYIKNIILDDVNTFTNHIFHDDITFIVAKAV